MNGTHQLLVHADVVNIVGKKINTEKKTAEALLDTSKEVAFRSNHRENEVYVHVLSPE
jgi:hypothetical protein